MESVTDHDWVGDPLLFRVKGQTDPLSRSRTAESECEQQRQDCRCVLAGDETSLGTRNFGALFLVITERAWMKRNR